MELENEVSSNLIHTQVVTHSQVGAELTELRDLGYVEIVRDTTENVNYNVVKKPFTLYALSYIARAYNSNNSASLTPAVRVVSTHNGDKGIGYVNPVKITAPLGERLYLPYASYESNSGYSYAAYLVYQLIDGIV